MQIPQIYSGCPTEPTYHGERDQCAICFREIWVDDIREEFRYVEGLGRVCSSTTECLKEFEHEEAS